MKCLSCFNSVAPASSCPARSLKGGHPLRLPLLPHLRLQPHRHLSSPGHLSCGWVYQAHLGQGAHCLCSHSTRGDEPTVLSQDDPEKMFQLLSPRRSADVGNSCLSTSLDKCMEIFGAFAPIAGHKGLQLAKRLKSPGHWTHPPTKRIWCVNFWHFLL